MHEKILIKGKKSLNGTVNVQGAKNAALPIMAASILLKNNTLELSNVPDLYDVHTMCDLLRHLGADVYFKNNFMKITVSEKLNFDAPVELVRKMRASSLVLGPLVARCGSAILPLPGGCVLGSRPLDFHLKGLIKMGAEIDLKNGSVYATVKHLKSANIDLEFPSVGATENLMMAATLADGTTIIQNAAKEPEIVNLADVLIAMGAKIYGAGTSVIKIIGQDELHSASSSIIPDRIEAATYLIAGLITGGTVTVRGINESYLDSIVSKLSECGVNFSYTDNEITAQKNSTFLNAVSIKTLPHPGFPTDAQPQFMALLTLAKGNSVVTESVFDSRLLHINEFKKMGAKIELQDNVALITGVQKINGTTVQASNLRAGAALILMGLAAEGETIVTDLHHVWRGYENMLEKLISLGADIVYVD
ncbi:MAG: UDP-N-acetylglucosamine 1-carboxyvinyltransferase [Synergistaceae bacterium]